jgi:hypothetical protein
MNNNKWCAANDESAKLASVDVSSSSSPSTTDDDSSAANDVPFVTAERQRYQQRQGAVDIVWPVTPTADKVADLKSVRTHGRLRLYLVWFVRSGFCT